MAGKILDSHSITIPKVWPSHTLWEARAEMVRRLNHVKTRPASRLEAQELLTNIDAELALRKKAGRTH